LSKNTFEGHDPPFPYLPMPMLSS